MSRCSSWGWERARRACSEIRQMQGLLGPAERGMPASTPATEMSDHGQGGTARPAGSQRAALSIQAYRNPTRSEDDSRSQRRRDLRPRTQSRFASPAPSDDRPEQRAAAHTSELQHQAQRGCRQPQDRPESLFGGTRIDRRPAPLEVARQAATPLRWAKRRLTRRGCQRSRRRSRPGPAGRVRRRLRVVQEAPPACAQRPRRLDRDSRSTRISQDRKDNCYSRSWAVIWSAKRRCHFVDSHRGPARWRGSPLCGQVGRPGARTD